MTKELDFLYDALWINERQQNVCAIVGLGLNCKFYLSSSVLCRGTVY
jgi:hypothetical protein